MRYICAVALSLVLGIGMGAFAQTTPPPSSGGAVPASTELRSPASELFEAGSRILLEHYYGFSPTNLPALIAAAREELTVLCPPTDPDCAAYMGESKLQGVLESLQDRHTSIRTTLPDAPQSVKPPPVASYGLRFSGPAGPKGTLVSDVMPESVADKAGIQRGQLVHFADPRFRADPSLIDRSERLDLTVDDGRGVKELSLTKAPISLAWMPSLYVPRGAPANTLALRVPHFRFTDVGQQVHALVAQAQRQGAAHLIVDLRGNPGGIATQCIDAAGAFIGPFALEYRRKASSLDMGFPGPPQAQQDGREPFDLTRASKWEGRTVVLVDSASASCAEKMAVLLQDQGVKVVGQPTAGVLNTSSFLYDLPFERTLMVTAARSVRANGTFLPERVTPDVTVPNTPMASIYGDADPWLTAAYALLTP